MQHRQHILSGSYFLFTFVKTHLLLKAAIVYCKKRSEKHDFREEIELSGVEKNPSNIFFSKHLNGCYPNTTQGLTACSVGYAQYLAKPHLHCGCVFFT